MSQSGNTTRAESNFFETIGRSDSLELKESIAYDLSHCPNDTAVDARSRHQELVDQVLAVEHDRTDDAAIIMEDEFDGRKNRTTIRKLLSDYTEDGVCTDGGEARFDSETIEGLYGDSPMLYGDSVQDVFADGVSTIVLEEAQYFGDTSLDRGHPLRRQGELDIAVFDLSQDQPTVKYIEVKSNGYRGLRKAKRQLRRFKDYAEHIGWRVETEVAVFDSTTDQIYLCEYASAD